MCVALDKLEELTPNLPLVPSLSDFKIIKDDVTNYKLENGEATSESIYSTEEIAIAKFFIPKDGIFRTHVHSNSDEWLILLKGILEVAIEKDSTVLHKYDSIKITADKPHKAVAVENSTIIAITVPRDDGFPE